MAPKNLKRKRGEEQSEPDRRIIIAIDFGTTYSGCAWVHTGKSESQNLIIQWPDVTSEDGLEGVTSDKVPTELLYNGDAMTKWGFQIPVLSQRHKLFKLQLDPDQPRNFFGTAKSLPDRLAAPPGYNLRVEKMVTDYLSALRKQVEQVLHHKIPQSALKSTPISYCMTVPAVWSDKAQAKTRQCAELAGLNKNGHLQMISEPEAAAVYALDALNPHGLEKGDTFVLCDAGGGTVDLISYQILALAPLLELREVAPGSGGLCGSTFINERFAKFLINKFGKDENWDDQVLEEAMEFFEVTIKRSFHGDPNQKYPVHVSGLADNAFTGVLRGRFTLSGDKLRGIFQPVLQAIIALVKDQIRAMQPTIPKAVLLVGGFGQSSYLRVSLRNALAESDIKIMQPPNGWSAVVRGALMKALMEVSPSAGGVKVSGRMARRHYGLLVEVPFDKEKHDASRRYWDSCDGFYRIWVMEWCIKKGDVIKDRAPIKLPYYKDVLVSEGHPSYLRSQFFVCDEDSAPLYHDHKVTKLAELTVDMSKIPASRFPQIKGIDGKAYYRIDYHIHVTLLSGSIKYDLIYKRKNYGTVKANYQ